MIRALLTGPVILLGTLSALVASAATFNVSPGEKIADAIERAQPGDVIEVEPGIYQEALTVDTPNLTLRGLVREGKRPILEGRGMLNDGVIVSGSPFSMTGFGIRHYKGNGVSTQGVDGVFLSDLLIDDTGIYGLYPVQSSNITITHCTVTGISDAAIYVGESNGALVAFNEVHHNVAGIEIENTNDAIVRDNLARNNTAGILVFVLPNKVQKEGRRNRVLRNWVVGNNTPNFGDPNAIVGALPHGTGIIVMGADQTTVEDNWVKDNHSGGIAVIRLAPEHAEKDPELEPHSDGTRIGFNYLQGNGTTPHPFIAQSFGRGADILSDGTGTDNCADLPDSATRGGAPIPECARDRAGESESASAALPASPQALVPPDTVPEGAVVVRIRGMRYLPHELTVAPGTTVAWINEDAVTHTVTSGRGTTPTRSVLDSPFLLRGQVYQHTFEEIGGYEYLCLPHVDQAPMRGARIVVTEPVVP